MSRKISFSGIILVGTLLLCTDLSAQRLCRRTSNGVVRWVSGNCPDGFVEITNSVRSEYLRANSVTTAKIQDGAVTSSKILDGTITNDDFSSNAGDRLSHTKVNFSGWTAPNNSVATASIQDNAVTSAKILNGTITNEDFSNDTSHRLNHAKVNFSGWTAPNNSVATASIQNGAVTNAKININIDTSETLPYHTFLSTVNLTSTGTGYIPLLGYNLTPQASETGLTASNEAFGCTSGTITVVLDTAPGTQNSRTFELRNGTTTITDSSITISGTNKTGSVNFSSIPLTANLVLYAGVSGSAAAARATIYFVCK
jgi:hypothetical protein